MSNLTNKGLEEEIEISEDWKVYIRKDAFRKMISHILRFINKSQEDNQEAIGLCIGEVNLDDKALNLINIIPVSHGDLAELGFTQEIHEKIKKIEEKITTTNLKMIGWYHSRLKGGLFFSNADKNNQTYFQNEKHPYGFGIIFDINLLNLENNFGFEIFRLKDFSKGIESEYVRVLYELEIPKTLDFFKWVKAIVEDSAKKDPIIIYEFDEIRKPLPEELQEIPEAEIITTESEEDEFNAQLEPIFLGFQKGASKFVETFIDTYKSELSNWMINIKNGSLKGTEYIRSAVNQMKNSVEEGLEDIQNYFDRSFAEISNVFVKNISEYINKRIITQKEFVGTISELFKKISDETKIEIENNLNQLIEKLKEKISYEEVKFYNINQINNEIKPLLKNSSDSLAKVFSKTNRISEDISNEIKRFSSKFSSNLNKEIENLNLDSDPIQEKYKEIENLIDRLQKVISDFRQLK